jgi:hypothetical protein
MPKACGDGVSAGYGPVIEERDIEGNRFVFVVIPSISDVHKLADAALDICLFQPALVEGKRHVANHIVSVVAREVSRHDGVYAI